MKTRISQGLPAEEAGGRNHSTALGLDKPRLRAALERAALPALLLAFVALALSYSVATPIFEAPDELYHYPYVKHIADGKGLPVPGKPDAQMMRQEASQPPLYYLLGALITFPIDTGPESSLYKTNPHAFVGIPSPGNDNKNFVLHDDAEAFPYKGVSLAVHLVRLLSVLYAAGTVFFVYLVALELMPKRRDMALGAAALVAFIPQFLFIAGSVNNDNLVVFLSTLCLYLMLRFARTVPHWWQTLLVGCVAGLAAISKATALGLLPVAAVWLAWLAWRGRSPRLLLQGLALFSIGWLAVAGWWYVHNWLEYGDPTALVRHLDAQGRRSQPIGLMEIIKDEGQGLRWSFWGVFGIFDLLAVPQLYRFFDAITLVAVAGLLLRLGRRLIARRFAIPLPALLLGLWTMLVFAGLLRWTQLTLASQGRLLFPAIAPLAILLLLGLTAYVPLRYRRIGSLAPGAAILIISALMPPLVIGPAYTRPPALTEANLPQDIIRLDATLGEQLQLLGYRLETQQARSGQIVKLKLYWKGLRKMDKDYSAFVHIIGDDGKIAGQEDRYPGRGLYPTSRWLPGEIIEDEFEPRLLSINAPFEAPIEAGLYQLQTYERLPAKDSRGVSIGSSVPLGSVKVKP
ncbi:MAG: glycosyltransferase family 39 protein [Chloroflexi bacterium]|nr:glycosyltransferase family 39 protein [Chloroflexota bacterium]